MGKIGVADVPGRMAHHGLVWSKSTAGRVVAEWFEKQHRPELPRVTLEHGGGRGRPGYRIDTDSLDAWVRAQLARVAAAPVALNCNAVANDGGGGPRCSTTTSRRSVTGGTSITSSTGA